MSSSVISHESSVISNPLETDPPRQEEENGQLTLWWNSDEPPDPDDFGGDTPDFREAWKQWEKEHPDLAEAIARQYYQENLAPPADVEVVASCEIFTTSETLVWVDPELIQLGVTQTRKEENLKHVEDIKLKMLGGEWEWEREPLPEFIEVNGLYYPASGNHRSRATQFANKEREEPFKILGRVRSGTIEDAQLAAIRSDANNYHGLPESRADFRNRVEKFLNILEDWGIETQIRELELLKLQPHASEQIVAIDQLLNRIYQGGIQEEWSSRIIACYLQSPRAYRTIATLINTRQSEARFRSVLEGLSEGDWVQFLSNGQERRGKVHNLSEATVTVEIGGKGFAICLNSPTEILETLIKLSGAKPEPSPAPIPQRKKKPSISRELKDQARSLGLPTSEEQVLPDMGEVDRDRNASPHDVDDRPFASPEPVADYLIGFRTNIENMDGSMVASAIDSILNWLHSRDQVELMEQLLPVSDAIRTLE